MCKHELTQSKIDFVKCYRRETKTFTTLRFRFGEVTFTDLYLISFFFFFLLFPHKQRFRIWWCHYFSWRASVCTNLWKRNKSKIKTHLLFFFLLSILFFNIILKKSYHFSSYVHKVNTLNLITSKKIRYKPFKCSTKSLFWLFTQFTEPEHFLKNKGREVWHLWVSVKEDIFALILC